MLGSELERTSLDWTLLGDNGAGRLMHRLFETRAATS
jgi:hypothetical protein